MKRLFLRSISLFIFFLLFFVLIEILLRIFWKPDFLNPKYKRDDYGWISKNVSLNRFGYRDFEYKLAKSENTYRIYVLGDSYTYGWYIDDINKSSPKVLEEALKKSDLRRTVEVINAARPGYNFKAESERFMNEGVLFQPDLVIVGINPLDLAVNEFPPKFTNNKFLKGLRLYWIMFGTLERRRVALKTYKEIQDTYQPGTEKYRKVEEAFKKLKNLTESVGAELVVVVFPQYGPSKPNSKYAFEFYHNSVSAIGKKLNIKIVDLLGPLESVKDKKTLVLNPTDPHPSELLNEFVGKYLAKNLSLRKSSKNLVVERSYLDLNSKINNLVGIVSLKPSPWVFFDRKFGNDTQKMFLPGSVDTRIAFLENSISTAKFNTHQGWPGAKLDYNVKPESNIISISKYLYGYQVIGIGQIKIFWREDGNQKSRDLDLSEVTITKNDKDIEIKPPEFNNLDFVRLKIDLAVYQADIDGGRVASFFSTNKGEISFSSSSQKFIFQKTSDVYSMPSYFSGSEKYNYIWADGKEIKAKLTEKDNQIEVELSKTSVGEHNLIEFYYAGSLTGGISFPLATYVRYK